MASSPCSATDNVILAYSHVAHDCVIGDHLVMSSQSALAGHIIVEDHVNIGWGTGVHQFCRVGAHAMLGGLAKVVQDVPPFMIVDGNPAVIRSINKVGLERSGFSPAQIERVKHLYAFFSAKASTARRRSRSCRRTRRRPVRSSNAC